jgi:hypothetical protein
LGKRGERRERRRLKHKEREAKNKGNKRKIIQERDGKESTPEGKKDTEVNSGGMKVEKSESMEKYRKNGTNMDEEEKRIEQIRGSGEEQDDL